MSSPAGYYQYFDLGMKGTDNDVSNGDIVTAVVSPGFACTVVGVKVILPVLPTAGTLAVTKGSTSLLAANVNLASGVTALTVASPTLTTDNLALHLAATDYLKAVWTITTNNNMTGAGCTVIVEPDTF